MSEQEDSLLCYIKQLSSAPPTKVSNGARIDTDLGINNEKVDMLVEVMSSEYGVNFTESGINRLYKNSLRKNLLYISLATSILIFCLITLFLSLGKFVPLTFLSILALLVTFFALCSLSKKLGYKSNELTVQDLLEALNNGRLH